MSSAKKSVAGSRTMWVNSLRHGRRPRRRGVMAHAEDELRSWSESLLLRHDVVGEGDEDVFEGGLDGADG